MIVTLLLCGGIGIGGFAFYNQANQPKDTGVTEPPADPDSSTEPPSAAPPSGPMYGVPPVFAQVGECVQKAAPRGEEVMLTTACTSGTLRIMQRFENTADSNKCGGIYEYSGVGKDTAGKSYVLCMNRVP